MACKSNLFLFSCANAIILLHLANAVQSHASFRPDYHLNEETKTFYKLHTEPTHWAQAKDICDDESATLYYPRSQKDLMSVITSIKNVNNTIPYIFVGIHSRFSYGLHLSVDGKRQEEIYLNWGEGEPNHNGDYKCVAILLETSLMYTVSCDVRFRFVCERNQSSVEFNKDCETVENDYYFSPSQRQCFKVHSKPNTWHGAFKTCYENGAQLAVIDSPDKANYIVSLISIKNLRSYRNYNKDFFHIGFHDLFQEGVFRTLAGKKLEDTGYATWEANHPTKQKTECGAITPAGTLLDVDCYQRALFVCEKKIDPAVHETLSYEFRVIE